MFARWLPVLLLVLAAVPVHAAPAPFQRPEPAQPDVVLRGWLRDPALAPSAPSFIARQSDYESVVRAYGIANPPRVDFRTHFLFVHVGQNYGQAEPKIDGAGDLHVSATVADALTLGEVKGGFGRGARISGHQFLIKSYRRGAVKSVNGVTVPKN